MFPTPPGVPILDTVVYVPRAASSPPLASKENIPTIRRFPMKPSPPKRQKTSTGPSVHYVPSSQSDEEELPAPKPPRDLALIRKRIQKWKKSTPDNHSRTPSCQSQGDSDAGLPFHDGVLPTTASPLTSLPSPNSERDTTANSVTRPSTPLPSLTPPVRSVKGKVTADMNNYRPLSPPLSDSSTPPLIMDTDQLIAKIKAEVMAEASHEHDIPNVSMYSSDLSSDEDGDKDIFGLKKSSCGENLQKANSSLSLTHPRRSRRLLDHSPSPIDPVTAGTNVNRSHRIPRRRRAPNREPVVITTGPSSMSLRASNPLTRILKDQQKKETNGCGTDAISAVEQLVASGSELRVEDLDDTDDLMNMASLETGTYSLPDVAIKSRDSQWSTDASISEARVEQLLGAKEGQAVGKILNRDRDNRTNKTTAVGIQLFNSLNDVSQGTSLEASPAVGIQRGDISDAIFNMVKKAVNAKDTERLIMMFDGGLFGKMKPRSLNLCIRWLFNQALAPGATVFEEPAYRVLSTLSCACCTIPCEWLLLVLLQMGADSALLATIGLRVPLDVRGSKVSDERRRVVVYRLVSLISHFSWNASLQDKGDVVVLLLLVALDTMANPSLRRLTILAIDDIVRSLAHDAIGLEPAICAKVFKLASQLSPLNQCHLLSLLRGGCLSTARIARWLSLAILVGEDVLPKDHLNHPLPLSKIIRLLAAPFDSGEIFDVQNREKTDFEDLVHHINILGIALTDIDRLTEERVAKCHPTKLESICIQLAALHGKILDTRAAHLDRSRAKAAFQSLSFRIRYQCAAIQNFSKSRSRIEKYFTKQQ